MAAIVKQSLFSILFHTLPTHTHPLSFPSLTLFKAHAKALVVVVFFLLLLLVRSFSASK